MEITPAIKKDFLTFNDDQLMSTLTGTLNKIDKPSLIFRNDKYKGIIERKKLLKTKIDLSKTKIANFTKPTPILNEHADIIESAYLMHQSNLNTLPVESDRKITGVLCGLDLIKLAVLLPELKDVKISDIKIVKGSKINKDDPVSTAIEVMYKERLDYVPIFWKSKLYGILTYKDLMKRYLNWSLKKDVSVKFSSSSGSKGAEPDMPKLASLPVSDFSTNDNLITIEEKKTLKQAIKVMVENNISNLIVTKAGGVEGLLTVKNILRKIGSLKIPQNFNIQFIGLTKVRLKPHQKYNLKKIASNEAFKLQRLLKNEFDLIIHMKDYSKEGNQHKFSINMRIEFPGQIITSAQSDWNFETALRKTFNNAKNKLKKKFRSDSSWRKSYE